MSDIIENTDIDRDTVSPEELQTLFSKKYKLLAETAITIKKASVNKMSVSKSLNIAVGLLDNSIEVYKLDTSSLSKVCRLRGDTNSLTEVVFSKAQEHLVYSAGYHGVKLWDIRTSGPWVQEYRDEEGARPRVYESMDVSCSDRVVCAGTETIQNGAYLVFWDQRLPEPLGGYSDSHNEEITQVKFHEDQIGTLASGSIDGIVNIYDIDEPTEDDALIYSCKVNCGVEKLTWLSGTQLACSTQANDVQIWDTTTGDKLKDFDREKISRSIKRSNAEDCYVVDAYMGADDKVVILAGSLAGKEDVFRSLTLNNKKLQPTTNFTQNKQIVRCCAHHKDRDILVTTGESGLIDVWGAPADHQTPKAEPDEEAMPNKLSKSLRLHDNRHKPY